MKVKGQPNGRALRGRRAYTTFYQELDLDDPRWVAYNLRADADSALLAELAAYQCLQTRFINLISITD